MTLGFLDILRPARVVTDRIDAEPDNLAVALVELGLQPGHVAELGRADRCEILWMREQDHPSIADPFMKVDNALGHLRSEVWSFGVDSQRHGALLVVRLLWGVRTCESSTEWLLGLQAKIRSFTRDRQHKGLNNRAENSHQPRRRRERQIKQFKSAGQAGRFLSAHDPINNLFHLRRDHLTAAEHRASRTQTSRVWAEISSVITAA